jgi:5-methyltetrahydropteroyltriglutamate--homocysteine methyltransferase
MPRELAALREAAVCGRQALRGNGIPVITDGEQAKPSFVTYAWTASPASADCVVIHLHRSHAGSPPEFSPFRYGTRRLASDRAALRASPSSKR